MKILRLATFRRVLLVLAFLVVATPAAAQTRTLVPDFGDIFEPELSARSDGEYIAEALGLSERSALIVQTLLADYEHEFATGVNAVRGELSSHQPLADETQAQLQQVQQAIRAELTKKLEDVRARLSDPTNTESMEDFRRELEQQREVQQARMEAVAPPVLTPDEMLETGEAMIEILEPWLARRASIRESFDRGLSAIIDEEQAGRWPAVSRTLTRNRELRDTRLSGEGADLIEASAALGPDQEWSGEAANLLEAYEVQLHQFLLARRQHLRNGKLELFRAQINGDRERIVLLFDQELGERRALRDFQDQFRERIAGVLDPATGRRFRSAALESGYPRYVQPTRVGSLLAAAPSVADLDETDRRVLEQLSEDYRAELAPITERLLARVRAQEPHLERQRMAQRYAIALSEATENPLQPVQEVLAERAAVDRGYFERLKAQLTDEQLRSIER